MRKLWIEVFFSIIIPLTIQKNSSEFEKKMGFNQTFSTFQQETAYETQLSTYLKHVRIYVVKIIELTL